MLHLLQILGLTVVMATAAPATPVETGPAAVEAQLAEPQTAGLQVVIDPATGRIVDNPTDIQLETLSEGVTLERRRSPWELREFLLDDGGRGVYLDGWADHSLTVQIGADGRMRLGCSQGDRHSPEPGSPELENPESESPELENVGENER